MTIFDMVTCDCAGKEAPTFDVALMTTSRSCSRCLVSNGHESFDNALTIVVASVNVMVIDLSTTIK